jgi:hypothetical protein
MDIIPLDLMSGRTTAPEKIFREGESRHFVQIEHRQLFLLLKFVFMPDKITLVHDFYKSAVEKKLLRVYFK